MTYFSNLVQTTDPSVTRLTPSLAATSTQLAIKDSSGSFILVNPLPGTLGVSNNMINGPSQFGSVGSSSRIISSYAARGTEDLRPHHNGSKLAGWDPAEEQEDLA